MGGSSDSVMQSVKSFSLPRFKRRSSAREQRQEKDEMAKSTAEDAARVQKAAAWQWYMRGVGDAVPIPTKRPPVGKSPPFPAAPIDDKSVVHDGRISQGGDAITHYSNVLHKKMPLGPAPADSRPARAATSRFKAEAPPTSAGAPQHSAPSEPSAAPNSTILYDEFELSGLRTQMADFVERLQFHQQLTAAPHVTSTIPFHMRPISALYRLLRKVVSGSIIKSTNNYPLVSPALLPEDEDQENTQHHVHHYIHHHHHHYHCDQSPEESGTIIRSRRRYSESSSIRLHIPNLLEAESANEEEEEAERRPLSHRRRHSDSFAAAALSVAR